MSVPNGIGEEANHEVNRRTPNSRFSSPKEVFRASMRSAFKWSVALTATVLFLLACASSPQVSQDDYLANKGFEELLKGNYRQAEANFEVALSINPDNAYALLNLGVVYQNTGRIGKAREMYEKVIELDPNEVAAEYSKEGYEGKSLVEIAKTNLRSLDQDSDQDGVWDDEDECPETPQGATANDLGCWVLKGLVFDPGRWKIKPEVHAVLDGVALILIENPELKIEIQGHTDNTGPSEYNLRLSEKRAREIRDYLIRKGINEKRLKSVGYGSSKPAASNNTPEGRAQNRRVELKPIPQRDGE